MVKYFKFKFIYFFIFLYLFACVPDTFMNSNAVIKVGGRSVTTEDLERIVNIVSFENGVPKKTVWASINSLIDRIVDGSLILEYGKDMGIALSEIELRGAIKDITRDYPLNSFKETLISRCIDYKEWIERLKEQKLIKKIIEKKTEMLPPISHISIESYHKEHVMEFRHSLRANVTQVVSKTREDAEVIMARIRAGEKLNALVKQESIYSTPQDDYGINWITKDTFPAPLSDVIFSIPIGGISDIIKTTYGYHILKVLQREPEGQKGILEVKDEIKNILLEKTREEHYQKWLKELRNNYHVKINHSLLDKMMLNNEKN